MAKVSKYQPNVSGVPIQTIVLIKDKLLNKIRQINGVNTQNIPNWPLFAPKDESEKMES